MKTTQTVKTTFQKISEKKANGHATKPYLKKFAVLACLFTTPLILANFVQQVHASTSPAQIAQRPKASKAPLDLQQFGQLADLAALNICFSITQKIEYKKAAIASTASLFTLVKDRYNSQVQGMPLVAQDSIKLNQWIAGNILIKASTICPSKLPPEVVADANKIRSPKKN